MITFNKLGEHGRLGNQLFQYAALRALGLKNGYEFKIPPQSNKKFDGQNSLMREFNITTKEYTPEEFRLIKRNYNEPTWRTIDENFFSLPDNSNIGGFFQSTWYFEEYEDIIRKELSPKDEHITRANEYLDNIKEQYPDHEIVALHIRRGNVVNDANKKAVFNKYYEPNGEYFQYLEKAKEHFADKKVKYLVFSGGAKWDENNETEIDWCKKHLIGDEYLFSENGEPMGDFTRIMHCDHNIMSPSSSYGWWGAYLNPNPDKIVIAPKMYLVSEPDFLRYKQYPENFIVI
jgi:hypothetical protein